jgi:hypothetical protein
LGVNILGKKTTYAITKKELKGYGHAIQLDFTTDETTENQGMEIYGYELTCEQAGDTFVPLNS